jgi:hypothetical protein
MESYGLSTRPSSLARPDLIIIEYRFLIHSMEKCIRKLQKKFDPDPTVGSKIIAFRTVHLAWLDQTSSSSSIDSSSTPWKSASGNSSKSLMAIQRSMEIYGLSNRPSSLARPDLIIIEYRFLIHSMEKCIRKLQ